MPKKACFLLAALFLPSSLLLLAQTGTRSQESPEKTRAAVISAQRQRTPVGLPPGLTHSHLGDTSGALLLPSLGGLVFQYWMDIDLIRVVDPFYVDVHYRLLNLTDQKISGEIIAEADSLPNVIYDVRARFTDLQPGQTLAAHLTLWPPQGQYLQPGTHTLILRYVHNGKTMAEYQWDFVVPPPPPPSPPVLDLTVEPHQLGNEHSAYINLGDTIDLNLHTTRGCYGFQEASVTGVDPFNKIVYFNNHIGNAVIPGVKPQVPWTFYTYTLKCLDSGLQATSKQVQVQVHFPQGKPPKPCTAYCYRLKWPDSGICYTDILCAESETDADNIVKAASPGASIDKISCDLPSLTNACIDVSTREKCEAAGGKWDDMAKRCTR
ncbi:MAG: hypothetical protein ACREOH_08000 [Candidatus Entotheonellia bacterium]